MVSDDVSYGLKEIIIDDPVELKMIDEGGYSTKVTFNVKDYLTDAYGEVIEIPETGVNVYIKAEVIDAEGVADEETGEITHEVMNEPNTVNNCEMVTCENLQIRTGQDVTITSTLDIDEDGSVRVRVDLQNTRLTTTETGNVIVTLLGEDGSIIAQKQSYNGTSGLITLEGEAKYTEEFTFKGITDAFTVSVIYTDMILDGDDIPEGLDTLLFPSLDENVTLDDFKWDEDAQAYVYSITVKDLTWVSMITVARDAGASITVNGEMTDFYTVAMNLDLSPGETNVITIDVKNRNGIVTTYIFTVYDETDEIPAEELIGEGSGINEISAGSDGRGGSAAGSGTSSGTGDNSRPLMLFIIMIACAAVIVGIVVSGRRKRLAGKR